MKSKELRNHLTETLKEKVDFHNASYNEKTTPVEGWYTPI